MQENVNLDLIAIGDAVADTFIRLSEGEEVWDANHTTEKLCLSFADKVPYEFAETIYAVGNSANAAVSASRLGLKSALISNIGDDQIGKDCLESLHQNVVDTSFIKVNQEMKTNHHYVLWFHDERTILIKHFEYPYEMPNVGNPKWLYLSSLGASSLEFHTKIADYLENHPDIKLCFQPGTYQMKFGTDALKRIYVRSDLFFCNVGEAQRILKTTETDIKKLMQTMREFGPKTVVITDGPKGAYAYDGQNFWFMKPYPDPKPPYERTGAGDAFSSTVTSALILGKSLSEALEWGAVNSMSVVQDIGAQRGLLSEAKIKEWLDKKPGGWQAEKI
ncbi:MAG TPA: carbohydrate kinase family protein [Candidatus Paceibacterota bacterium]|nr:carbohydrate kinase family protein [Candidatus Paceibacterota bacterium]